MNETRNVAVIDKEINQIKKAIKEVKGTETEVYARIVGYYRSLRNWNKGKKEEYSQRVPFARFRNQNAFKTGTDTPAAVSIKTYLGVSAEPIVSCLYFYSETCPNCPPVKSLLRSFEMKTQAVNVDTQEGFKKAEMFQVFSIPYVVFFNKNDSIVATAHSIEEIQSILRPFLSQAG